MGTRTCCQSGVVGRSLALEVAVRVLPFWETETVGGL